MEATPIEYREKFYTVEMNNVEIVLPIEISSYKFHPSFGFSIFFYNPFDGMAKMKIYNNETLIYQCWMQDTPIVLSDDVIPYFIKPYSIEIEEIRGERKTKIYQTTVWVCVVAE